MSCLDGVSEMCFKYTNIVCVNRSSVSFKIVYCCYVSPIKAAFYRSQTPIFYIVRLYILVEMLKNIPLV